MDNTQDSPSDASADPPVEGQSETQNEEAGPSALQPAGRVKAESRRSREGGKRRNHQGSKKGHRCTMYGCNRSFLNMQDLINHVSVHYKPTQSMQDKKFICSMNGCGETLDSMQDLMAHLKVHYKPNRYFKCENCMQHFRTHRSLFKHLHVCSDNHSRPMAESNTPMPPVSGTKLAPAGPPLGRQTSVIQCIKKGSTLPVAEDRTQSVTAASASSLLGGQTSSASNVNSQTPNLFPAVDPSLFTSPPRSSAGSYLSYLQQSAYSLPQGTVSQKLKPLLGNPGLPVSNAMWKKKNQGHTNSSRIVWQHTKGSYRCMQCTFSTATRDQMDKHIEELHKNPPPIRPQEDIDFDMDLLPFHSKLPAEMEPSLLPHI
ncbi:zinc finger protein 414-like [Gastrophryne carolinensis]